jgi:mono/diheme cytochrome c family protein/glucose/arabinose dehydrogenase
MISRFLCGAALLALPAVSMTAGQDAAGATEVVHVTGHLRDAATGEPVPGWEVIISGAALSRNENSALILSSGPQGEFDFQVPAGSYELETASGRFQDAHIHLDVAAGVGASHDFDLRAAAASNAYVTQDVKTPRQMVPEVSGITFSPGGNVVAVTRRGEVWIRDAKTGGWRRFAYGLLEPFGVVAGTDRDVYVTTRGEFMHLSDTTGSGEADVYAVVDDSSGMTGNYHEFSYGLVRDKYGNFYGANGMASKDGDNFQGIVAKGQLKMDKAVPGFSNDDHRSLVPFEGWVYEVTPQGEFIPYATGFRQAMGIGLSPQGELFATDVSGSWVPTSELHHVQKGRFYGHPDGLKWDPNYEGRPVTIEMLRQMRTPPVVYVPRGPLGSALGQPVWDTTGGKFGPFGGQIFIPDWTGVVVRVDLEMVAGDYQGAVFLFAAGQGLNIGGVRGAFAPDGSLYIGQTARGWGSTAKEGIQRISWTGAAPVEIRTIRLTDRGFTLAFTVTMSPAGLAAPGSYRVKRFRYNYSIDDGSLRVDEVAVPVTGARAHADGMGADIDLVELMPGFVYEVATDGVRSAGGDPVAHPVGYYTANRLLAGSAFPAKSMLVAAPVAFGPPNPAAGGVIFRANCVVCHQPDGRGSKQVGTPDFTLAGGPLTHPDAELINQVTNGGKVMPPFGHVLGGQEILDVVSFLKQAFGSKTVR